MTRYRAGAAHLVISVIIAALLFLAIHFVWYPGALLEATGGRKLLLVIAAVHLCVGPLITTIIFKQGKRGLAFDLAMIAVVQVAALTFGVWMLYEARPAFIVFIKDRFELARADDIDPAELAKAKPPYDRIALTGPSLVGARLPRDASEGFRVAMSAMRGGPDIQGFPQYFVAYEDVRGDALRRAERFAQLRRFNAQDQEAVERLLARLGGNEERLRILPLRAGKRDLTVVLDAQSGDVLHIAALRPWEYQ